ncbi:MAG: hypothetical protein WAL38_35865, partial [Solirubrobacteraceae bacterium]
LELFEHLFLSHLRVGHVNLPMSSLRISRARMCESCGEYARAYTAPAARGVGRINAPTIHRIGKKNPIQNIQ